MKKIFSFILFFISLQGIGQFIKQKQIEPGPVVRQGNVIGEIFNKTAFTDTVSFSNWGGATNTIAGNVLNIDMSTATTPTPASLGAIPRIEYDSVTSLDVLTIEAIISPALIDGTSYGVGVSIYCQELGYSIEGWLNLSSGTLGQLSIRGGDQYLGTTYATSTTNVPGIAVGDSLLYRLETYENTVTFSVRNLTDNTDWVSVPYPLTGTQTKHGVGHPAITQRGGEVNLHQFKFSSKQVKRPKVYLFGDSKFSKSTYQSESLVALLKTNYGKVYANSGVGEITERLLDNVWEVINLVQPEKVVIEVSNDIRFAVSSGTWQANLTSLYDVVTEAGIGCYFLCFYETDADQSAMDTWLATNYPDNYIRRAYTDLENNPDVLLADDIHLSAYGNQVAYNAIVLDGKLETVEQYFEMKWRPGDTDYPEVGDSTITNSNFDATKKLDVIRDGDFQWEATTYEPYSFRRSGTTITFSPPLAAGERIIIRSSVKQQWTTITADPPVVIPRLLDVHSAGIAAAFSTELLRTGQTNCIRVRRDNDDAEQDIGFDGNEIDVTALLAFVGANSGYVVTAYDQTTNGRDATNTTEAQQPRIVNSGVLYTENGKASWEWLGGSQALDIASFTFAQPTTMFVVGKNDGTNDRHFIDGVGVGRQILGVSSGNLAIYAGILLNFGANSTAFNLHTAVFNSASSTISRNNAGTVTGAANTSAMSNGIRIGSATGASGGITGSISAVILYAADKTTDLAAINAILNAYFSIY